jgi:ribosomal protein L11 methyltransferase
MPFLEFIFAPLHSEEEKSFLITELLEAGFESFVEEKDALLAYITTNAYKESLLKDLFFLHEHPEVKFESKTLPDINWNKEWESNYQPVTIAGKCYVRASFHPSVPGMDYEIIIEPGMAFGTAHHETTQLMASWLMELDVSGKEVLDMGCGTGILAILANKMGAKIVTGIDNDEWAWRNGLENFRVNNVVAGSVLPGDAHLIKPVCYDIVLANINRNVLLQDMKSYSAGLRKNGALLLSGFYQKDIEAITASASGYSFRFMSSRVQNDWAAVLLYKLS